MYISIDKEGKILGFSDFKGNFQNEVEVKYTPDDFSATCGLGKYLLIEGEIHTSKDWVKPTNITSIIG